MRLIILLLLILFSGFALAQGAAGAESPMSSGYLVRLVLGLFAIVVLIFVLGRFVSRFNVTQGTSNGALKIIAGLPTGARDRIVLLQVGEEQVLLGLTPGRIEKLHTLSVPVEQAEESAASGAFARKLRTALEGHKP